MREYVIDKLMLLIISSIFLIHEYNNSKAIVYVLVAVILISISIIFENFVLTRITTLVFLMLCLLYPEMILLIPVVIYDMIQNKLYPEIGLSALIAIPVLYNCELYLLFVYAVIISYEVFMFIKSNQNINMKKQIREIRDDGKEKNILLEKRNRYLIEKQDNEIYVATLKERNRIAREIHDNVGHMLTRSILQTGALITIYKEEPLHGQLISVKETLDEAMENIRTSVHDMHDESVDLRQTINEIVEPLKNKYVLSYEFDVEKTVDREYKYAIIGIVKEGVSNILKHSNNGWVDIVIRQHPGMYQILIHDYDQLEGTDGTKGRCASSDSRYSMFNENRDTNGIGLRNIEDRVKSIKGNVNIDTKKGFRLYISIPRRMEDNKK